ncbi:MAG: hypothetical protein WAM82_00295 [Thermoanaerobaculia bacterium]
MASGPTIAQARSLEDQVGRLVLVQTNIFIRELLRGLDYRPGANKDEFTAALADAIHAGKLTQEKLDEWLRSVEGWGNQHIYAHGVPATIELDPAWNDEAKVAAIVERTFRHTWRAETSQSFPEKPQLTRTDYNAERGLFIVEWHEKTGTWVRAKEKDLGPRREPDGDTYRYEAYRDEQRRSVMRFVLWLRPSIARRPIAGLFLRYPIRTKEHRESVELAWSDLKRFELDGGSLADLRLHPWSISTVIKRLDQQAVRDRLPKVRSKATTFSEGLASVRFVAPPDSSLPEIIRNVRLSLPDKAIEDPDLMGTAGEFHMGAEDPKRATSRDARVELFQDANRIRIWTELDEPDVWTILQTLDALR